MTCPVSSDHAWFETITPVAAFDCPLQGGCATGRGAEAPDTAAVRPVARAGAASCSLIFAANAAGVGSLLPSPGPRDPCSLWAGSSEGGAVCIGADGSSTYLQEADEAHPFRLATSPARQFLNSTFVNIARLRESTGPTPLLIHPNDAAERGIATGDRVEVGNGRGAFEATARVTDEVRPGVVVSYGVRWSRDAADGRTVNDTTSQVESDMGGGATFYDNAVQVALHPGSRPAAISLPTLEAVG